MIVLDLVDDLAPVRGDTWVHVLEFLNDVATPINMWGNGQVYRCEFRNGANSLAIVATAVQGASVGEIQLEAAIPSSLARSEIGRKRWIWDIERTEAGLITTIVGGEAEIKPDAANSPGPV